MDRGSRREIPSAGQPRQHSEAPGQFRRDGSPRWADETWAFFTPKTTKCVDSQPTSSKILPGLDPQRPKSVEWADCVKVHLAWSSPPSAHFSAMNTYLR